LTSSYRIELLRYCGVSALRSYVKHGADGIFLSDLPPPKPDQLSRLSEGNAWQNDHAQGGKKARESVSAET
jgi:hypothetical protein